MPAMESLAQLLPVGEIYKDLAQPAVREVGTALGNVAKAGRFVMAPFDYIAAYQSRWQQYLERIAQQVPEERLVSAHPQIVGPVVEGLRYAVDTELTTDLFLNLLARSIDRERQAEAHPAFALLIGQLSPDEALILYYLKKREYTLTQEAKLDPSKAGFFLPAQTTLNNFPTDKLMYPENFIMYMQHLLALNLAGIWQVGTQEPIRQANTQQIGVKISNRIALTNEFGELFARACVPDTFE